MSASYLLGLYQYSPVCYMSLGFQGEIVDVNDMWLSTFGYSKGEVLGKWFGELLAKETRDLFLKCFSVFKSKGYVRGAVFDVRKSDGSFMKVSFNGNVSFAQSGEFIQTLCIIEPTEINIPTYDQIFNMTSVPMIVFDVDSLNIVDINSAACTFYGYPYAEFANMKITDVNVNPAEIVRKTISETLQTGWRELTLKHRLADGSERIVEIHPSKLHLSGKDYICAQVFDVTKKVKAEEQLRSLAVLSAKLLETGIGLEEISGSVVSFAKMLTASQEGYAGSIDEDTGSLLIHAFDSSMNPELIPSGSLEFKAGEDGRYTGLWGHSLNTCLPFYTNDPEKSGLIKGTPEWHVRINNYLSYPVMLENRLVGQVAVGNSDAGYGDDDVRIVGEIAKLYALAIKSVRERQTDVLFKTIFDNMADSVAVYNSYDGKNFIFKTMNKAGLAISGFSLDDIRGRSLTDVYPGFQGSSLMDAFQEVWAAGEPMYHPVCQYVDDAHSLWVENYIFKLGEKYLVAIYRDITDLITANKAIQESEAKYRSYIEHSPDPILVVDKRMNIIDFNTAAVEKFEYEPDELRMKKITDLWGDIDTAAYLDNIKENTPAGSFKALHPHMSKSGKVYQIQVHVKIMPDGNFLGILQDMTNRIEMEQELQYLNINLQERVREEVEIRERQERILFEQKKLADMGQMINAIAHQWRQPINALGLYIQSVYESFRSGSLDNEEMDSFKADSLGLIQHMSRTIDDFRGFFQPDKSIADFEVLKEVMSLLKLIEAQLQMKGITVRLDCECVHSDACTALSPEHECVYHKTKIKGYPGEFKQAVINIIYNAADAIQEKMEKGLADSGEIRISLKSDKGCVSVSVSDNGTGIPESVMGKIFDPYFTTKDEGKGTGIGLYMSKLVIEQHMKGKIKAATGPDGACFEIKLPVD